MYPHLRLGDHGPDVELLQNVLHGPHYDVGAIDGQYGPRTEAAVEQYKSDRGLGGIEDGCGDETWRSLQGSAGTLDGMRATASTDRYVADTYGTFNSSMSPEERVREL